MPANSLDEREPAEVEIFTRPVGGRRWEYRSTIEIATADLTEWLRTWLQENQITSGEWIAGDKWGGLDSAVVCAEPALSLSA